MAWESVIGESQHDISPGENPKQTCPNTMKRWSNRSSTRRLRLQWAVRAQGEAAMKTSTLAAGSSACDEDRSKRCGESRGRYPWGRCCQRWGAARWNPRVAFPACAATRTGRGRQWEVDFVNISTRPRWLSPSLTQFWVSSNSFNSGSMVVRTKHHPEV